MTDQLNTTGIGKLWKDSDRNIMDIKKIKEDILVNSVYVNVCTYCGSKIDHNTYHTNSVKGSQMSVEQKWHFVNEYKKVKE